MLNVDGYRYVSDNWVNIKEHHTTDGFRQKNMNNQLCRDGTYGVDLSRNFGYQWGHDDEGSSADPCHANYRGSEAFSEPETRGVRSLATSLAVELYMSYETGQDHYVMPYSYSSNADYVGPRG